jgi:hypothetical protein
VPPALHPQPWTQARRDQSKQRLQDDSGRTGHLCVRTRTHDQQNRDEEQDAANTQKLGIETLVEENALTDLLEQQRPGKQQERVIGCG